MSALSYRMEEVPRERAAAADPFEGRGVFLEAPGDEAGEMLARLEFCLGKTVPAVAWGEIGVWVDLGSNGMDSAIVRDRWVGGRASEHW